MAGVAARPRPDVEDAHLQDIAGLGILDRDRPGQQVHAKTLAPAAEERTFGLAGAATRHRLVFARPVKHALRARIIGDHTLIVVVGMMGQRFDGRTISRTKRQGRRDLLAEIAPVNGRRRHRQVKVPHGIASSEKGSGNRGRRSDWLRVRHLTASSALSACITLRNRAVSGWRGLVRTSWAGPSSRIAPSLKNATRSATSSANRI